MAAPSGILRTEEKGAQSMRLRAPWWAYLLVVSFGAFFVYLTYLEFFPLALQIRIDNVRGNAVAVTPGGPAAEAGLRDGDRIVSFNGRPYRARADQFALSGSYESGKTIVLEIERDNQRLTISPVPRRHFIAALSTDTETLLFVYGRLALTFYFISGAFLLLVRPHDRLVVVLATAFLIMAAFAFPIPGGFASSFRSLPGPVQLFLGIPIAVESALIGFIPCWFSLNFPRPFLSRRWIWVLVAPTLVVSPLRMAAAYRLVYDMDFAAPGFFFLAWPGARIELLVAGAAQTIFFALNYVHLEDVNERRRVRLVIVAILLILAAALTYLIPLLFFPDSTVLRWLNSSFGIFSVFTAFAAAPVIASYALIRHRLFDIRVIIRQGLRYAAARGLLLGIVPVAVLFLGADIARQSQEPLANILQERGWVYAVVAAIAIAAHAMRKQWMNALDRRFFRERYNVHQIMREVAEEIRNARRLEAAAPRTVASIESALHSDFVALMVREPGGSAYRALAVAPSEVTVPDLAADSKLMGAFRLFAKPLDTSASQSEWLQQQLPHVETEFVRKAKIELLAPVALAIGDREALLALGRKKSEEPYSSEDKELLLAIANSLALLLERPAAAAAGSSGVEECPRCGSCYDSGIFACPQDGTKLSSSSVPRVLSGRYRLDRKLGEGGMGKVYSAFDTSLERQVALKLIREDFVSNAEAADRFRREAKAAAAITHPNIVILHDFAIDAGNRAFLVMELLSGTTLRQRIQQTGRVPQQRLIEIARGVCSALAAAHQRGLIHRDLKPENVFIVNDDGRDLPKVLDFGLAKFVAGTGLTSQPTMETGVNVLLGTLQYMSPEQLHGLAVSVRWDLWSLAIIIYEMLTGAYPFGNPTSVGALQNAILAARFTTVPADVPHSAKWQEFFLRTFQKDESQRPASAAEFLAGCPT